MSSANNQDRIVNTLKQSWGSTQHSEVSTIPTSVQFLIPAVLIRAENFTSF